MKFDPPIFVPPHGGKANVQKSDSETLLRVTVFDPRGRVFVDGVYSQLENTDIADPTYRLIEGTAAIVDADGSIVIAVAGDARRKGRA